MHVDPHTACPTLGHARLTAAIQARWTRRATLETQTTRVLAELDALLAQAHDGGLVLRVIERETGVPRSTAAGRLTRHRARSSTASEVPA